MPHVGCSAALQLARIPSACEVGEFVKSLGTDDGYEKCDRAVHERTGFHLSEQSPLEHVKAVTVPTLVAQVQDDTMTRPRMFKTSTTRCMLAREFCMRAANLAAQQPSCRNRRYGRTVFISITLYADHSDRL